MRLLSGVLRGVTTAASLLFAASALSACGEEEAVEIACCQLLLYCETCDCGTASWTIASSGESKACKAKLDELPSTCGSYFSPKDDAANACK